LPLKWFCWIPFKGRKRTCKVCLWFQRCHIKPLKFGKFGSWCPYEIFHFAITVISEVSMTPLKSFQRCQWHHWNRFSGVNDTTKIVSAVSMTPLKFEYNRFSRRIRNHMRNGFRPWIRNIYGVDWWKNRESKISWHCPFNSCKSDERRPNLKTYKW
jgi:hypothetical protein